MNFDQPARAVLAVALMYPLIASAFLLFWPEKVRGRAERYYRANPKMAKFSFSARWLGSEKYVHFLRVQGALGLLISVGLLVLLWKFS
jgi:hypothetical protein